MLLLPGNPKTRITYMCAESVHRLSSAIEADGDAVVLRSQACPLCKLIPGDPDVKSWYRALYKANFGNIEMKVHGASLSALSGRSDEKCEGRNSRMAEMP
jgi:hypothetical protein